MFARRYPVSQTKIYRGACMTKLDIKHFHRQLRICLCEKVDKSLIMADLAGSPNIFHI